MKSLKWGVLVGFVAMILLGSFPLLGPLVAGFLAGIITNQGGGKGALAGFLSGIAGGVIWAAILLITGSLFGPLGFFFGSLAGLVIIIASLGGALLATLGGFLGGALRS